MTSDQFTLGVTLPRRRALGRGDFLVSSANAPALTMIDDWRAWPNRQLALTGPAGAGKTHLAHVWMAASGAERVVGATLSVEDAPVLLQAGAVAVEGADALGGPAAEAALFHLVNLAAAQGAPLLLTGRAAPSRWPITLPDLASRVAAITAISLTAPDDALMRGLLQKHFADRHLRVGDDVVRFLTRRIDRSAAAAEAVVAQVDRAALASARRVTVPFVKAVTGL